MLEDELVQERKDIHIQARIEGESGKST